MTNPVQAQHAEIQQRMEQLQDEHCRQGKHVLGSVRGPNRNQQYPTRWCAIGHQEIRYEPEATAVSINAVLQFPAHHFGNMTQSQIRVMLGLSNSAIFTRDAQRGTIYILLPFGNSAEDTVEDHA